MTASATAFRGFSVAEPKLSPAARLESAMEMARDHFGEAIPAMIYVHPLTAAETTVPEGLELVERAEVGRFGYWFPTGGVAEGREGSGGK